ncbi:hypothetical protein [Streptomyces xanthii]|uniref:hypothetical protein n=1 Tax=Streptomyces xanthii TaxID=2768069 RepID=UPI001CB78D4B|nr:hypothetical protein [Streptomyces xanthii]
MQRAVGAVVAQLAGAPLHAPAHGKKARPTVPLDGKATGLTILPQGAGVLTRYMTVTGVNPADGTPVKQEVYVDARSGFPLLQYSAIQTFGVAGAAAGATGDTGTVPITNEATTESQLVVKGTGTRYNGEKGELNLYQGADGAYRMVDYGFRTPESPYSGPML